LYWYRRRCISSWERWAYANQLSSEVELAGVDGGVDEPAGKEESVVEKDDSELDELLARRTRF
jgi:hypothetical protein